MGPMLMILIITAIWCNVEGKHNISCGRCSCYEKHGDIYANCTGHNLTDVPSEIPDTVFWLDLTNNNLSSMAANQFSRFHELHTLNISGNNIFYLNDLVFAGLDNLRRLDLGNNALNYSYLSTSAALKPLRRLTFLNLSCNNDDQSLQYVSYPGEAISSLQNLEILLMDGLPNKKLGTEFSYLLRLEELHLSGKCRLQSLFNDTFDNVRNVKVLVLRSCVISYVEPGTMKPLSKITFLDVSQNQYLGIGGMKNVTHGLQNSQLQSLNFDKIVHEYSICVVLTDDFIENLQNTSLAEFSANHNFIEAFGNNALPLFPKTLKRMSLRENKFTFGPYIADFVDLTGVEEIDLSGTHHAHDFPQFGNSFVSQMLPVSSDIGSCVTGDSDLFKMLSAIPSKFENRYRLGHVSIPVPPNLTKITYSYSQLPYHIGTIRIGPNKLEYVDVSSNILSTWSGPVMGLENLKVLDLSNNLAKHIWPRFFHTFPGLEVLNVSDNFMGMALYNDTNGTVFRNQSNLRILNLRANYILSLHKQVFTGLISLEDLDLEDNSIHPNLYLNISHMKNLRRINCRNNQIRWIDQQMTASLNKLAETHIVTLDLSLNPIACTCYNLKFLSWMKDSRIMFVNRKQYHCLYSSGKNQSLENLDDVYNDLWNSCYNYFGLSLGTLAAVVVVVCLIVSAIGYRYRWKLTYWYYAAKLRYTKLVETKDENEFEFDVFVSFAEEDRDFVVDDLFNRMEEVAGLRLNMHQRNFKPGRPIATNIVDAVKNSKKTLVVLTPDFLQSYWCMFELQMGKMESFNTGRDVLVIVMLKQIPTNDIPAEILYHIQKESYLEYPLEGSKDMFWKTLIESLDK